MTNIQDERRRETDLETAEALHGLKTSPMRWQEHIGEILTEVSFATHPHDACDYMKKVEDSMVMMWCQVDDLLAVGRQRHVIGIFKELKKKSDVTYAGVT